MGKSDTDQFPNNVPKMKHLLSISLMTSSSKILLTYFGLLLVYLQLNFDSSAAFHLARHTSVGAHPHRIFYANGMNETSLPECEHLSVCNKIDVYDKPWIEKQCKCPTHTPACSTTTHSNDGHTIVDKTRLYKICEPMRKLPKCRYFRDITWTLTTKGDTLVQQVVNCICPKDSVAYMIKRQAFTTDDDGVGFRYSFACSPQSRVLCQRKEPCRLFTVKRRSSLTEVNTSTLCQCPRGFECPSHHTDTSVIAGKFYPENMLRTFSGYCV